MKTGAETQSFLILNFLVILLRQEGNIAFRLNCKLKIVFVGIRCNSDLAIDTRKGISVVKSIRQELNGNLLCKGDDFTLKCYTIAVAPPWREAGKILDFY